MKILLLIILILVIIVLLVGMYLKYNLNHPTDNGNLESAIDAEVKKMMKKSLSYGLVVGIYKGEKTFVKGYGTMTKGGTTPDGATIFQLASVTKLLTASTYQILSDEKVFDMDATLSDALGTAVKLSPQAKKVTLRQLATHTSGFPSIPKSLGLKATEVAGKEKIMQNPYGYLGPEYVFNYLETTEDIKESGNFEYSNFGMGLLGHVMEIVTKKDLESLVTQKLLAPLDMKNTAISMTPEMLQHLAQGYTDEGEPSPVWTFSALSGAGAFNSNAEDMLKFIRANIENTPPVSASLKKMHDKQFTGITGIGWMQSVFIDKFFGNQSIVWHNGMVGGYASYISVDTENKTGVIVLSNKSVDVTMLGTMLTRQARTQSWGTQQNF